MKKLLFILLVCCSLNGFGQASKVFYKNGNAFYEKEEYKRAIREYTLALDLDSNNINALNGRGNAKNKLGYISWAIEDYELIIAINPSYEYVYNNLGIAYLKKFKHRQAMAMYSKAIDLNPYFGMPYQNRGAIYMNLGNYEKAIADFTSAIENRMGKGSNRTVEFDETDPLYNVIGGDYIDAYIKRAECWVKLNNTKKALNELNEFIALEPNNPEAYYGISVIYFLLDRYNESVFTLTRAIELDPNNSKYYFKRAKSYMYLSEFEKANNDFHEIIRLDETSQKMYKDIGWLAFHKSNYKLAIGYFSKGIEIYPKYSSLYYYRGLSYFELNENNKGCVDLNKAKELGDSSASKKLLLHCN